MNKTLWLLLYVGQDDIRSKRCPRSRGHATLYVAWNKGTYMSIMPLLGYLQDFCKKKTKK